MRHYRFWFEALQEIQSNDRCELDEEESHHIYNVLRLKPGTIIELFDGRGRRAEAQLTETTSKKALTQITQLHFTPPPPELHLFAPLPKGKRQAFMIEKLQELGLSSWTPLISKYSESTPDEKELLKLNRKCREAVKQSGNPYLLNISTPKSLNDLSEKSCIVLEPKGEPWTPNLKPTSILIGPEGGWSHEEQDLFQQREWKKIKISKYILRLETAALSATTLARLP